MEDEDTRCRKREKASPRFEIKTKDCYIGQGSLRTQPRVHALSVVETRNSLREEVTKVMTRART